MFGALVRFALLNNITDDTVVSFDGTSTTTPPTGLLFGRVAEQSIPSYRRQGAHEGTLTGARVMKGAQFPCLGIPVHHAQLVFFHTALGEHAL